MRSRLHHYVLPDEDLAVDASDFEASSSVGPSSPVRPGVDLSDIPENVRFSELQLPNDDDQDLSWVPPRRHGLTDCEKALQVLDFLRTLGHFSLQRLLEVVFTDPNQHLKTYAGTFHRDGGAVRMMEVWWEQAGLPQKRDLTHTGITSWVVRKAAQVCEQEASWLTNHAARGPSRDLASTIHLPASKVTASLAENFSLEHLGLQYNMYMPSFQDILVAVIGRPKDSDSDGTRNRDQGRTMVTSVALNLRSRKVTYHAAMTALVLWDNRVPKRITQMFNRFGVTTSYKYQTAAVAALGRDAVKRAVQAASDPSKVKVFQYDNFNWSRKAWEVSVDHRTKQHDQVSAILVIPNLPAPGVASAAHLMNVRHFNATMGQRVHILPEVALEEILPSAADHDVFRAVTMIHVQRILSEELKGLSIHRQYVAHIYDPDALPVKKTEYYYLPTYDQEQGSVRGNMRVLDHYFRHILKVPHETFEETMFFVLGDRLTTARDRSAQDQRAVDRSEFRFDRFSSFAMLSGLMHFVLNYMQNIGRNHWGGSEKKKTDERDAVSLVVLRDALPGREGINQRKVDYYAWLRFLDVVLRSLVLSAAAAILDVDENIDLSGVTLDDEQFHRVSEAIVDSFINTSSERLEDEGVKKIIGSSVSGNAVLLFHELMTLHEMTDAMKHGHASRILRMLKFWAPSFYAGGSYNYSHETMELLHNLKHDWPMDSAKVAISGMLVNSNGMRDGFKPTDLHGEHLNDKIKENAHGPNATPESLERSTPALGFVQDLSDRLFSELGVEALNQHHAAVSQHADVQTLVAHLRHVHIFDFEKDMQSNHAIPDLLATGMYRLAGPKGGHAKHLAKHRLRLRKRHGSNIAGSEEEEADIELVLEQERDILLAEDGYQSLTELTLGTGADADADGLEAFEE